MAGIFDRVKNRGEMDEPIGAANLWSVVYMVARGVFTGTQARDALNARFSLSKQLTTEELTDLNAILDAIAALAVTGKLDYMLRLQALLQLVEVGMLTNEVAFRSELSLPEPNPV